MLLFSSVLTCSGYFFCFFVFYIYIYIFLSASGSVQQQHIYCCVSSVVIVILYFAAFGNDTFAVVFGIPRQHNPDTTRLKHQLNAQTTLTTTFQRI